MRTADYHIIACTIAIPFIYIRQDYYHSHGTFAACRQQTRRKCGGGVPAGDVDNKIRKWQTRGSDKIVRLPLRAVIILSPKLSNVNITCRTDQPDPKHVGICMEG